MKYIIITSLLILTFSCTKTTEDITLSNDVPVVSSFLSPNSIPLVQVSKLILFENDISDTTNSIDALEVYLSNYETKYQMSPVDGKPGQYHYIDSVLQITAEEDYYLEFLYNDIPVSSNTKVPLKPENFEVSATTIEVDRILEGEGGGGPGLNSNTLDLTWINPDNGFYLARYEYLEDTYDPINENIVIDYPEEVANVSSTPLQDSIYSIRETQFRYFGRYHIILYKITNEYAVVYESLNQSSLEDLSEPITNINNGKGIFASFNSDTLLVNVIEY